MCSHHALSALAYCFNKSSLRAVETVVRSCCKHTRGVLTALHEPEPLILADSVLHTVCLLQEEPT